MPKPGPKPVSAQLLELRGSRKSTIAQRRAEEARQRPPVGDPPPPPAGLTTEDARLFWARCWTGETYTGGTLSGLEQLTKLLDQVTTFAERDTWLRRASAMGALD